MKSGAIECNLCPKHCVIGPGESGDCRIRVNLDGQLRAVTYGHPCALHMDPIEKKPMFHMLPGSLIFSLATVGCNLHCRNCQNWQISQCDPENSSAVSLPPEQLVPTARRFGSRSVAYTYTEPAVYYEYAFDCSVRVREAGMKNVLVTAGYINRDPWRELCRFTDGANIDLKSISDKFYRTVCKATLKPVQDALVTAKESGVLVEVTNLIIPTLNDSDDDLSRLCRWLKTNLGADTPLHFSAFHPEYKMRHLPPTPPETLDRARKIARAEGLQFVYTGNILSRTGENTYCPKCGKLLIERHRYTVVTNRLKDGTCPHCHTEIPGVWQ